MPLLGFAGLVLLVCLVSGLVLVFRKSPEQNLQQWLAENHLSLVSQEQQSFSASPFQYLATSRDDKFFRIIVKTETGETKSGWVRASGKFSAFLSQPIDIVWDK